VARCAHVYSDPRMGRDGRCGRFASKGETLCATHCPKRKAATRAAHILRMRREGRTPPRDLGWRERLVREIAELAFWWDGPGSEGRIV